MKCIDEWGHSPKSCCLQKNESDFIELEKRIKELEEELKYEKMCFEDYVTQND